MPRVRFNDARTSAVEKRQQRVGQFTGYDAGESGSGYVGACGDIIQRPEFVVAMSSAGFSMSACGRQIRIVYKGKAAVATIKDQCPSCPLDGFDMTGGLFQYFEDEDVGTFNAEWEWVGAEPPPPATSTSSLGPSKSVDHSGSIVTATPTSSSTSDFTPLPSTKPFPAGVAAGIALGVMLTILIALLFIFHFRKRRKQRRPSASDPQRPEPFTAPGWAALTAHLPLARYARSKSRLSIPEPSQIPMPNGEWQQSKSLASHSPSSPSSSEYVPSSALALREVNHEDSGIRIAPVTHHPTREVVLEHPPPYTPA